MREEILARKTYRGDLKGKNLRENGGGRESFCESYLEKTETGRLRKLQRNNEE
jgi:hypothetical protein